MCVCVCVVCVCVCVCVCNKQDLAFDNTTRVVMQ